MRCLFFAVELATFPAVTKIADYDYDLPEGAIAQAPAAERDGSRLLILDRRSGGIAHRTFRDIGEYLRAGDLLVLNNTRVIPARIMGRRKTGGRVEALLVRQREKNSWTVLLNPSGRLHIGEVLLFEEGFAATLAERGENGRWSLAFAGDVEEFLRRHGAPPLPPYIRREDGVKPFDAERYQTVYAARDGAIAAPTAGLHFTRELIDVLRAKGVEIVDITLHVGLGTFKPVKADEVEEHRMEAEEYDIPGTTLSAIERARREERRIVAVGTTSCRTLETFARTGAPRGGADLFIYPPFEFRLTDALITNFHLPKSTLLLLVSAFAGRENVLRAYREAIREGYRFYSYGDAMIVAE